MWTKSILCSLMVKSLVLLRTSVSIDRNTCSGFHHTLEILNDSQGQDELKNYDWVLFLDADMVVVDSIAPEELFSTKPYIGVHHPCHFLKMLLTMSSLVRLRQRRSRRLGSSLLMIFQCTSRGACGVVESLKLLR